MQTRKRVRTAAQRELPADLVEAIKVFSKAHGEGIVAKPGTTQKLAVTPTGCFVLDFALNGGWPEGYASMVYGYHSTAKSTMLLNGVREFQLKHPDKYVVWIDVEGLYDEDWARKIGCDISRIIASTPEYGEMAVDILEDMLQRVSVGLIILDSVPACAPMKVLDNSAEDDTMAALARLMGKMCSKMTTRMNAGRRQNHYVSVWLINQLRNKVGVTYGSPRHLPGGFQINHVPTTKVWLKLTKEVEGKDAYGSDCPDYNESAFKIEKRKHGSSINDGAFDLILNATHEYVRQGTVDNVPTLISFAKKMGFISGGGGNYNLLSELRGEIVNEKTGETRLKPFTKFSKFDDISNYLYQNDEEMVTLWRSLLVRQRVSKGLDPLPRDGYLVAPHGRLVELIDED